VSELHYTYRVEWSPEDEEWVGLVAEFPSLSWLEPDPVDAMRGIRDLVGEVVADMREEGETPPAPLADRRYSGKVFVRTSPALHRRLTIEAAEQGVSVNQWSAQKLAERSGGVEYHAAFQAALEAVEREWVSEKRARFGKTLDESLAALICLASVREAEQHAVDSTRQTGDPVFRWKQGLGLALPDIWGTYFKRACPQCEARQAAGAEEENAVEEAGQLA
jgi:predicted HicB family RNase H-like nuclease